MYISLLLKANNRIDPGTLLPAENILTKGAIPEGQGCFYWSQSDKIIPPESKEVLIEADSYIVNHREYPIGTNYCLKAYITPDLVIIPQTRDAIGGELDILPKTVNQWPIIARKS
jgi:hypothetical protein